MALASLYDRARKNNTSLPKAHGFIVDHKVRAESTEEAAWVADQLRSKCEQSDTFPAPIKVLTMHSRYGDLDPYPSLA